MSRRLSWVIVVATIALAMGASVYVAERPLNTGPGPAISAFDRLLAAKLPDAAGKLQPIEQWRGKVLVVNFWATWCPPCREEMPALQALWDKTGERPFVLLAVSVGESRQTVRSFAEKNGYDMPIYLDPTGKAGGAYGARSIPTTFVLDKEGRAIAYAVGGREYDSPEALAFFAELAAR